MKYNIIHIRRNSRNKWLIFINEDVSDVIIQISEGDIFPIPDRTNECTIENDRVTYKDKMGNLVYSEGARRQTMTAEQRKEARALIEKILEKI